MAKGVYSVFKIKDGGGLLWSKLSAEISLLDKSQQNISVKCSFRGISS